MRIAPATLLLVPALALAQVPIRPQPETRDTPATRPAPAPPRVPPPGGTARPPAPSPRAPGAQPDAAAPAQRNGPSAASTVRATDARCVPLAGRFMLQFNK